MLKKGTVRLLLIKMAFIFMLLPSLALAATLEVPRQYSTIADAVEAAQDGDVILISPGKYTADHIDIRKRITIASLYYTTGDESYIKNTIINKGAHCFDFKSGSTGAKLVGLTFTNTTDTINPYTHVDIVHNRFIDCPGDIIDYEDGGGGYCAYNYFENSSDDAIDLDNAVDVIIEYNVIMNSGDDGIEVRLHEYSGPTLNIVIRYNEIGYSHEDGIQLIDYDDDSDRVFYIHHNLIHHTYMAAIGCMPDGNTKENYGGSYMVEPVYLYNNTLADNHYGLTGGDNIIAINNIIMGTEKRAMYRVDGDSIVDYTLFYNNGTDYDSCNLKSDGTFFYEDPNLDDSYVPQEGSVVIDAGAASYSWQGAEIKVTDYEGQAPDIGAFEANATSTTENKAPVVSAGDNQVLKAPDTTAALNGSVKDDGLPESSELVVEWSVVSKPEGATVTFEDVHSPSTNATFSMQGTYVLKLTASDGELSSSANVEIKVVQDGDGKSFTLTAPGTLWLEAEDYSYLYEAKKVDDSQAANGQAVEALSDSGISATEHLIVTTVENQDYFVWLRARASSSDNDTLFVSWNNGNEVAITVEGNDSYQWVKMDGSFHSSAGIYPLMVRADKAGIRWDRIVVTTDSSFDPSADYQSVDVGVSNDNDDAEEREYGSMYLDSSDLEMVQDNSHHQIVGIRFANVNVPPGAKIKAAYIQFTVDETSDDPTELELHGEAADNASSFSKADYDISSRATTEAKTSWTPESWDRRDEAGPAQRTPDLSGVIQEIVNRQGWQAGNSLAIIVTGSGKRVAVSHDKNPDQAPKLHIDYESGSQEEPSTTFSLSVSSSQGGHVNKEPDKTSYASGAKVTLTAVPEPGYKFSGWSGDANGTQNPITIVMDGDKNITASFVEADTTNILRVPDDYETIEAAVEAAQDGDTILIAPGSYEADGITITKKLTIASNYLLSKNEADIQNTVINQGSHCFFFKEGSEGSTLTGLSFESRRDPVETEVHINVTHNIFNKSGHDAISFDSGSGGYCAFNIIKKSSDDGIDIDNDVDVVIEANKILECGDDGISVSLNNYSGNILDTVIRRNVISGNEDDGIDIRPANGATARTFEISRNVIDHNGHVGILLNKDKDGSPMAEEVLLYNNTVADNKYGVVGGGNVLAVNNVITGNSGLGMYRVTGESVVDYTLFFNNGTDHADVNLADGGVFFYEDPLMSANYSLKEGSVCIDAGASSYRWNNTTLTIEDYNGSAPDLGGLEY